MKTAMLAQLRSFVLLALYQTTLLLGILLLPVALLARRVGVPFPFHRLVRRLGAAYDRATSR